MKLVDMEQVYCAECEYKDRCAEIFCDVHRMPTIDPADVVEVKRGRWDWREEWETHPETRSCDLISCGWYCTSCGVELGDYLSKKTGQHIILDDDTAKPKLANCPNCGADMREAQEE